MSFRVMSASALESEVHYNNQEVYDDIERVGTMIMDLHEGPVELDVLMVIPEGDENERWQLCFGGSTLSLDFLPNAVNVVDFNLEDGEEVILREFKRDEVKAATQWLYNKLVA